MTKQLRLSRPVRPKPKPKTDNGFDGFSERIRELWKQAGSQKALAAQSGVSQVVISNWIGGEVPKADTLARFAEGGRYSTEWLLFGRGSPIRNVSREGRPLAEDLGAHLRSRLAAADAGVSEPPGRTLADTVDGWLSDEQLGQVALQRLEELLPRELLEIERWVTRRLEAADLLADLTKQHPAVSPRIARRLLRSFDELLQQPSGATALDAAIRRVVGAQPLVNREPKTAKASSPRKSRAR